MHAVKLGLLLSLLATNASASDLESYEQTRIAALTPTKSCASFEAPVGFTVLGRDSQGNATQLRLRVLAGDAVHSLYVIGDFNDWGKRLTAADQLHRIGSSSYFEGTFRQLRHGTEYRLLLDGEQVLDPSAPVYTSAPGFLNSVFWDHDRPAAYKSTTAARPRPNEPLIIAEGGVYTLAQKWPYAGRIGPAQLADTYGFIASSGLPAQLAQAGYNNVELLPVVQTVDGDNWAFAYQPYGIYATNGLYGTPDDFARMVDAFNQAGVGVILDTVLGHFPAQGDIGSRSLGPIGLGAWRRGDGQGFFGNTPTPWGTVRWDFANPEVRHFLVGSVIQELCRYPISGLRLDNVDGILTYDGPGGGGRTFLTELLQEVRSYKPQTIVTGEIFRRTAGGLQRLDEGGIGLGFSNQGPLFDFFKDNLQRRTEDVDIPRLAAALENPWQEGEALRVGYLTDHDEAANIRGGATGAYVASLIGSSPYYEQHKTEAFAALALFSSAAYLDMPQLRLVQEGSANTNPAVAWSLLLGPHPVYDFMAAASKLVKEDPAFALDQLSPALVNHADSADGKRIISLRRRSGQHLVLVVVNLGHQTIAPYQFGVERSGAYQVALDSDSPSFGGSGGVTGGSDTGMLHAHEGNYYGSPASLLLPRLGPYEVVVLIAD